MSENTLFRKMILLGSTAISLGAVTPAWAQQSGDGSDIIVTARRVEERLQDVPISITVLNQEQLNNNNVSNPKDLAALTPGLQINSRYGSDSTTFSIRGFTQEIRTYATVGTYFADVVAPRGSGATFGGDGAGPGSLFDLQNIQVLKGPQGTLQGRNVTGGAVLLVPRKPTGRFEGYVEGSIGDYDLRRVQAVLNVPIGDTFRMRVGIERNTRDGYLKNIGRLGDGMFGNKGMGNVDYTTLRVSAVADLTPNLENYLIGSYTKTRSNGVIPKITDCRAGIVQNISRNPADALPLGNLACAQIAREAAYGPWTVSNRLPSSASITEQWQLIDTTTWQASDSLTVKGILAYGEYRGVTNLDLFGSYYINTPTTTPGTETEGNQVGGFAFTSTTPFTGDTNAQSSFVAELQLQGHPADSRLTWQAGVYAELNDPLGFSGVQTATFTPCTNIATLNCVPFTGGRSAGTAVSSLSATKFRDYAIYGQASYNLTEQLKFTAGLRYTWDKQISIARMVSLNLTTQLASCTNPIDTGITATFPLDQRFGACSQTLRQDSEAPTWLLGLDYKPIDEVLLYGKWSRGYRQGGIAIFAPDTLQYYKPEKVDTYEIGAKASWRGTVPGSFNIAGYYNKFTNQQLQLGTSSSTNRAAATAAVFNAGKSRMYGFEAELNLRPFEGFQFSASYAYLNSKLQQFVPVTFPSISPYDTATQPAVGGPIPNSQPHKVNISANYTLPLPESVGAISFGGTYLYTARYRAVPDQCPFLPTPGCQVATPEAGFIPATNVVNLNVNWNDIAGAPVDASFFMTNVTNEVVYQSLNDGLGNRGFRSSLLGEPRMYGLRLKYRFGS